MPTAIHIVTLAGHPVANAVVQLCNGVWQGRLDGPIGSALAGNLFARYEQAVNGQVLSLIDGLEEEIAGLDPLVLFPDGRSLPAEDLQVFPSSRQLSFRAREVAAASGAA